MVLRSERYFSHIKRIFGNLYKSIEEKIADWNLAQADLLLYRLEYIFDKIES